jgi:excinuclease ABC subunit A
MEFRPAREKPPIRLIGVRQNNLKNVTAEFPARKLTVVTGLSGSGKSSLVFDTLYAEGQRRYVESLSTYTRQFLEKMPKPEVEAVQNIPPAIALEQRNHVVNSRSTVGTQTEIVDYLRVFFARVGRTECVDCGGEVRKQDSISLVEWALTHLPGKKALICAPLEAAAPSPQTQARKKTAKTPKKSATKTKTSDAPSTDSLLQVLKEQGYRRVLWRKTGEVLDLEELGTESFPKVPASARSDGELAIVIDRMRMSEDISPRNAEAELRSRLTDSIEQAIAAGQGRIEFHDLGDGSSKTFDQRFACVSCGRAHRQPEPNLFSFNSPMGACSHCSGFGHTLDLDEGLIVPDPSKTLKNGAIDPFSKPSLSDWQADMFRFAERQGISIGKRYRELTPTQKKMLWEGMPGDKTFPGILACFEELKRWKYKLHIRVFVRRYQSQTLCRDCKGARLQKESLAVKINGRTMPEVLDMPVADSAAWFRSLKLSANERKIGGEILTQVDRRLEFLNEVGVGYLTLSRLARTLSGGEFQRINLATQLGNGLCGTLYVLDEPSIGLHAADTDRLIRVLERLRDQGNTVVVVEHDLEVMKRADWLLEMGPGAGRRGGELVIQGPAEKLISTKESVTGQYLSGETVLRRKRPARGPVRRAVTLMGCRENNLQNINVEIPLDRLVVVTGVSGSGKSTLVHKTLHQALAKIFDNSTETAGQFEKLYGAEQLGGIVLLDQTPIGKSSRSNPATYLKAWEEIRRIYANQVLSLRRGYTPQHFSFNVDGGRCPSCKGEGEITIDMHFMAEVKLPCEECDGKRFKKPVLDVTYRNKNVHELLHMTINEAYELFRENSILVRKLNLLREVGLGYLLLGQSATTLSGGESQRLKIAATLDDRSADNLLYIFDEPTTGLHMEDVRKLMDVLHDLVDSRQSVIVIEHHLDVIAQADWIIDIGPGGGKHGGYVVAEGTPEQVMMTEASITGQMLRRHLNWNPPEETGPLPLIG